MSRSPIETLLAGTPKTAPSTGIGLGWLALATVVAAVFGALGGRALAFHALAPELAQTTKIKVIDAPSIAMSAARPGDPDAGRRHLQRVIDELVAEGYIVIPLGGVLDAPVQHQLP